MANNAIGILFEVQGGGDINGASGKRINGQLRNLIGQINKSDTVKLKFQIDSNYFNQQIKQLQQQLQSLSAGGSPSGGGKGSSQTSQTQQQTKAYREASAAVTNYYNLLTQLQNAMTRTTAIVGSQTEGFGLSEQATAKETERWGELVAQVNRAREAYTNATSTQNSSTMTAEQYAAVLERSSAAQMKFNLQSSTSTANAQSAWSNLTAKVHDYVSRVEYSASRNEFAARSLQELRNMANSTDYRGYDALKQKLAEVQQYINQNSLATETWGQKLKKTLGSRIRSALAGVVTAKFAQTINNVYKNVVNLDKAMTNLQIATGKTREETRELIKGYSHLAQQLGATTIEVAEAADTWLRQGYSAEESSRLIKNSMMLSKLGQMESAEASKALTSAMNGYGVAVEDSIKIVDKFTAVDMEAAASAGDIATAMAETATSAKLAGVSMDTLIGYITTVKEVTQDSAESVGTFYKTLFARMNNVAAGNFVDEETGESLNDVETVLNKLGITLRSTNGEFRNSSEVLGEVASRWSTFDNVQQHAIATAFAGTRQQEKFIVLMENYGDAMNYAETATNSAGTATEKYGAYTESFEGQLNSLKAAFEQLSTTMLNSDWLIGGMQFLTGIINVLNGILSVGDGFIAKMALIVIAIALLATMIDKLAKKAVGGIKSWSDLVTAIQMGAVGIGNALKSLATNPYTYITILITLIANFAGKMPKWVKIIVACILLIGTAVVTTLAVIDTAVKTFMATNPLGWILLAISAIISAIMLLTSKSEEGGKSLREIATESKDAWKEAKDELQEVTDQISETEERIKELQEISNQGKITLVEQQELDKLLLTVSQLEAEKKLLEELEAEKKKQAEKDAADYIKNVVNQKPLKRMGIGRDYDTLQDQALHYDELGNHDKTRLLDTLEEIKEFGDILTYTTGDNISNAERDINEAYNRYHKLLQTMSVSMGDSDTALTLALNMPEFSGVKETLSEYSNNNSIDFNTLSAILDKRKKYTVGIKDEARFDYSALTKEEEGIVRFIDYLDSIGMKISSDDDYLKAFANSINNMFNEELVASSSSAVSFLDILNGIQEGFDALSDAVEDMEDTGFVSAKSLKTILEDFPQLEKYLIKTEKGYKLVDNALDTYIKDEQQRYVNALANAQKGTAMYDKAYEELKNFIAVSSTLRLSAEIEKETEALKAQKEAREEWVDSYKEMVDVRKDLLASYADEVNYQKELARKQRELSKLQTKLSVARLDSSASGQARVRELEEELREAEEDFEDFTLEHAIDVLTQQLDDQYEQYKQLVDREIEEITRSIDNVADIISSKQPDTNVVIENLVYDKQHQDAVLKDNASNVAKIIADIIPGIPKFHSGGFVGGAAALSSNEEFAKLLKGEFVSTPAQMKHFMEETLPAVANYQTSNGTNEFNAPLIEIKCESVTSESIPALKKVVNEAVSEIKKQLDSGMSRTGYKRSAKTLLTKPI